MIFRLLILSLMACNTVIAAIPKQKLNAPLFGNLGNYHRTISTKVPLAQRYFDQGLILFYSFEYGESIRSFRAAIKEDPNCAMCYWGLALALGSKTDMPLNGHELEEAKEAIQSAAVHVKSANAIERAYIAALKHRYLNVSFQSRSQVAGLCSSYSLVSGHKGKAYANEMHQVTKLFPNDTDAKVLYAAALFDVTEWDFWDYETKQAKPYTLDIIEALETAMVADKNHPGANHLYVHLMEFSPHPKRAINSAHRLSEGLVPGSEHMAHMPCHTHFTLGLYHDAIVANQRAIGLYKKYIEECKAQGFEPEIQYLAFHNYDYLVAAESMAGRKKSALAAARTLRKHGQSLVKKNSFLQKWLTPEILTLARFGEWKAILQFPKPSPEYQYALGIWYYAQGLAHIELNQLRAAHKNLNALKAIIKEGPIDKNLGHFGHGLLQIGENILEGLLAHQSGHTKIMLDRINLAIKIQSKISNNDPPSWYFPVRQLLGDALLSIANFREAKMVFQRDLEEHPNNGWSLFGLAKSLRALGEEKAALKAEAQFRSAWKYSDLSTPVVII